MPIVWVLERAPGRRLWLTVDRILIPMPLWMLLFLVGVQEDRKECVWVLFDACVFAGETFAQQPSDLYVATQWICSSFSKCMQSVGLTSWGCVVKLRCARRVFTEPLQVQGKFIPLCSLYLFCFWTEVTQKRWTLRALSISLLLFPDHACTLLSLPKRAFNFVGAQ